MKNRYNAQKSGGVLDSCLLCIFHNTNGTCGNTRSIMFGVNTNGNQYQSCNDRRYYTREASKKPKKKRKIQSIYDYEYN